MLTHLLAMTAWFFTFEQYCYTLSVSLRSAPLPEGEASCHRDVDPYNAQLLIINYLICKSIPFQIFKNPLTLHQVYMLV